MSDNINLRRNAAAVEVSKQLDSYSRVTIIIDDDTEVSVGTDTGRELTLECPWGTETMAQNILASLSGYQYQPLTAQDALLHPAAELGDAITVNGLMSGVYSQTQTFGRLMQSTVSAPHDEEIDHEYPYVSPADRKYRRQLGDLKTTFTVEIGEIRGEVTGLNDDMDTVQSTLEQHATDISAKVSKEGGNASSFGWTLTDSSWSLFSGSKTVLLADSTGVTITGKIQAESGYIGGSSGFSIDSKKIYNGVTSLTDVSHTGIYLGTDGIALGKGKFVVTSAGKLTAKDVDLTGKITASSGYIGGESGFTITSKKLYNGKSTLSGTADGVYIGTDGISLGAGFKVDKSGNLTATSGKFTGSVYASSIKSTAVDGEGGSFSGSGLTAKSVAKGKTTTAVQGTLEQVGTNKSNIEAIQEAFVGTLTVYNLVITASSFKVQNASFYPKALTAAKINEILGGSVVTYLGV